MSELHTLLTGLAFGEFPRWYSDRLWFSDFGTQEVGAVDLSGQILAAQVTVPGAGWP